MKRGLKEKGSGGFGGEYECCSLCPDEKGTERYREWTK